MTKKLVFVLFIGMLSAGCGSDGTIVLKGKILDSPYEIEVHHDSIAREIAVELASQAEKNLEERYKLIAYNGDFMETLNEERSAQAPAEFEQIAALALTVYNTTEGAYDYRLGGVRELWKFYNRKPKPPEPAELAVALADAQSTTLEVSGGKATIHGRGNIDFGMLAEGSAVDYAAGVLLAGGITKGEVSLGKTSRIWGGKSEEKNLWEFALPPLPKDSIYKIITPPDGAFATLHPSNDGFEYNGHLRARILDPFTGFPSDSAVASVGWADQAAIAGAYTEAFFVMGRRIVFTWINSHQPAGAYLIYINPQDGGMLGETDAHLAECVADSLPFPR